MAALLAATALAGCRGRPFSDFPIGLYGVDDPAIVRSLRDAGFDSIRPGGDVKAHNGVVKESDRLGLTVLLHPAEPGSVETPRGARRVRYLEDEPDVAGMSRDRLSDIERAARVRWPNDPTAFVIGDGRRAREYPRVADVIMVDWYPVPHLPLESAGEHVRLTAAAADGRKVWAVLQAMDWRDFPQHDPKKPRIGRFPKESEMRFMTYDAALSGAEGIWYYTYSWGPGKSLALFPERLQALTRVARELRAMAPIFADGLPRVLPFPPKPGAVAARAWTWRGRDYLVLLNRGPAPVAIAEQVSYSEWTPLFDSDRGLETLQPYQVLALKSRYETKRLFGYWLDKVLERMPMIGGLTQ